MHRLNLLQFPLLRKTFTNRWPLLITRAAALGGFVFAILTGIFGTPVGNRNFAIVAVWIAWWAALMLVIAQKMHPFTGCRSPGLTKYLGVPPFIERQAPAIPVRPFFAPVARKLFQ